MFWRTSYSQSSQVDVLLDYTEVSLADLLECLDLLHECKTKNPKLLEYLANPTITKKLLDYALLKESPTHPTSEPVEPGSDPPAPGDGEDLRHSATLVAPNEEEEETERPDYEQDSTEDAADVRRHQIVKYGFIATEIFAADLAPIYNTLFGTTDMLQDFLDTMLHQTPTEVDPMAASNWSKLFSALLLKRTIDSINLIKSQPPTFVQNIIDHGLQNSSIMQILLKLVGIEELLEARGQGVLQWLVQCNLIPLLVEKLNGTLDPETHFSAASAVLDVIAICQSYATEPVMSGRSLLVNQLKCRSTMSKLLEYMLDSKEMCEFKSSFTNGMTICIELIRRSCSPDPLSMPDEQGSPEGVSPESAMFDANQETHPNRQIVTLDAHELVLLLADRLQTFRDMLTHHPSQKSQLQTTMGPLTPLGIERLRVLELLCELVRYARMDVERGLSGANHTRAPSGYTFHEGVGDFGEESLLQVKAEDSDQSSETFISPAGRARALLVEKLINSKILVTCIELFFAFPWNNLLHGIVYDMIFRILNGPLPINRELALTVLKDAQILNRIVLAHRTNDLSATQPRGLRLGYMGHITLVADEVVKFIEQDDSVREQVAGVVESEDWVLYVTRTLPLLLDRDRKALGGERPSNSPATQFDIGNAKSEQFLAYLHETDDDVDEVEESSRFLKADPHYTSAQEEIPTSTFLETVNERQKPSTAPDRVSSSYRAVPQDGKAYMDGCENSWWLKKQDEGLLTSADWNTMLEEKGIPPEYIEQLSLRGDEDDEDEDDDDDRFYTERREPETDVGPHKTAEDEEPYTAPADPQNHHALQLQQTSRQPSDRGEALSRTELAEEGSVVGDRDMIPASQTPSESPPPHQQSHSSCTETPSSEIKSSPDLRKETKRQGNSPRMSEEGLTGRTSPEPEDEKGVRNTLAMGPVEAPCRTLYPAAGGNTPTREDKPEREASQRQAHGGPPSQNEDGGVMSGSTAKRQDGEGARESDGKGIQERHRRHLPGPRPALSHGNHRRRSRGSTAKSEADARGSDKGPPTGSGESCC